MLAQLTPEMRALRLAEQEFDRAEQALISTYEPRNGWKRWAARDRYRVAQRALDAAIARLEKRKCELAGRRHLRIASTVVT
jgi:prefoldin subunit 5